MIQVKSIDDLSISGGWVNFKLKSTGEIKAGQIPEWKQYFIDAETEKIYQWDEVSEYDYVRLKGIDVISEFDS